MACLEESYLITADDENSSVAIRKDVFGNLTITLEELGDPKTFIVSEELVSQFAYAINRLT